jgi:hypothetical protein
VPDFPAASSNAAKRGNVELPLAGSPLVTPSQPHAPAGVRASMDVPWWSFNQRRKSMQGGPAGQRRSLNIGNNVVSVEDLYKVGLHLLLLLLLLGGDPEYMLVDVS